MNHLIKLIQINHSFQKSVNLQLDLGDYERIGSYIPTRSSVAILKRFLEAVSGKTGENATILIGPYGKGKSHLLLVLLALLHGDGKKLKGICNKIEKIDSEVLEEIKKHTEAEKKYLPILISAVPGADLNNSFIFSLQDSLKRENLGSLAPDNYFTEAVKTINRWKTDYPDTYALFEKLISKEKIEPAYFEKQLEKYDRRYLNKFMDIYPELTSGSKFQPMLQMDAVKLYQQVNRVLVEEQGYAGMFLIFDEFSKYLEGHSVENFSNDMKTLQDMCELANASKTELFLTMVAHKSIHEYGKTIDRSVKDAFRGVEGRIREIEFIVSAQNNYELIADTITKIEPDFSNAYQGLMENKQYENLIERTYQLTCFSQLFTKDEYEKVLAKGCFPMLPLSAYVLLNISEKVAQNERTIFTFLADEGQGSLSWLLKKNPEELIGVDKIYDYFKSLFRETADQPQIHNEWNKAETALAYLQDEIEIKIVKAMAIIRMVHREEELPAKEEVLRLALGYEKEIFETALNSLVDKNLIIYRSSQGVFAFRENAGADVEKAIARKTAEISGKLNICHAISEISDMEYVLPKKYNQEYAVTRYFQYEFLLVDDFLKLSKSAYLFEEKFADGKILALIYETPVEENLIREKLESLQDKRIVVLYPEHAFCQSKVLLKYEAIKALKSDEKFLLENEGIFLELDLYLEDIAFEINTILEQEYLPENGFVHIFDGEGKTVVCKDSKEWNNYLSKICESYYGLSPKVNHELLNIETVGAQYRKARNMVVKNILEEKECEGYLTGTSPESMVYRAAFVHTIHDPGCQKICEEIESFFRNCAGKKQVFYALYERLQGKDYGARKGIIPLFLAKKLADAEGTAVVYLKNKELEVTYETLNNVNDFPDKYELYIEPETIAKDQYLEKLEEMFCEKSDFALSRQNRVTGIVACMQKWYRALPQYTMVTSDFDEEVLDAVSTLRNLLKRAELNPRELLFDKIPQGFKESDYEKIIITLKMARKQMDQKLLDLSKKVAAVLKKEFGASEKDNLKACLLEWYKLQSQASKDSILSTNISRFMKYLEQLTTNDEEEIVSYIARIVMDMYLEDWNDLLLEQFCNEIHQIRATVEEIQNTESENEKKSKFIMQGADGTEITRFFDADITDSTSTYLQNMIEEALEDFGETLEMNQKVAVLLQAINKLVNSSE